MERLATADDYEIAGVGDVLTYDDACAKARKRARVGQPNANNTVGGALDRYEGRRQQEACRPSSHRTAALAE
jgi:hypothetical protein